MFRLLFYILIGVIVICLFKNNIENFSDELKTKCNNYLSKSIYNKFFETKIPIKKGLTDSGLRGWYEYCWDTDGDYINLLANINNKYEPRKFFVNQLFKDYKDGSCDEKCKKKLCSLKPDSKIYNIPIGIDGSKNNFQKVGGFGCPTGEPPILEPEESISGCDNNIDRKCLLSKYNKKYNSMTIDFSSPYHYSNSKFPYHALD